MYCPKCGAEYRKGYTKCTDCNVRLTNKIPKSIVQKEIYASPLLRIIASLLDWIIISGIITVLYLLNKLITQIDFDENTIPKVAVIFLLIYWLYCSLFESSKLKATLGKVIFRFLVVDTNLKKITFFRATVRFVLKLGIGLFTLRQMSKDDVDILFYDSISETRVIYKKKHSQ